MSSIISSAFAFTSHSCRLGCENVIYSTAAVGMIQSALTLPLIKKGLHRGTDGTESGWVPIKKNV